MWQMKNFNYVEKEMIVAQNRGNILDYMGWGIIHNRCF